MRINVLKLTKPGISYKQKLVCFLLEILDMKHKKRGYNVSRCIDAADVENKNFVNIQVSEFGFTYSERDSAGQSFSFTVRFYENHAENIITDFMANHPETRQAQLVMDVMMSEKGKDLVVNLRQIKSRFNIDPIEK